MTIAQTASEFELAKNEILNTIHQSCVQLGVLADDIDRAYTTFAKCAERNEKLRNETASSEDVGERRGLFLNATSTLRVCTWCLVHHAGFHVIVHPCQFEVIVAQDKAEACNTFVKDEIING